MGSSHAPTKFLNIPSQQGKLVVITGGNSGIGFEAARQLAGAGAGVLLAIRNEEKGNRAVAAIRAEFPDADVSTGMLDLASLDSVAAFAQTLLEQAVPIDILMNNAGIMAIPNRKVTSDGFELQLETNYLGHFALTAQLMPLLLAAAAPRVVHLSSMVTVFGRINFDDLQSEQRYRPWRAYAQSKLAMLIFALQMHRLSVRYGWGIMSNAAHPGSTRTNLQSTGPSMDKDPARMAIIARVMRLPGMSQHAAQGALPGLFAATSPLAEGGAYYGPDGPGGMTGDPARATILRWARNENTALRLWQVSEDLTNTRFPTHLTAGDRAPAQGPTLHLYI